MIAALLLACAPKPAPTSVVAAAQSSVRIVLVGDTGKPGEPRDAVAAAIAKETVDAVVVLGDLVYPMGPACPNGELSHEAADILDERILTPLSGSGAPIVLVLGNHDVGHDRTDPARVACYLTWAEQREQVLFPAPNFTLDLGPLMLAVIDTNPPWSVDGEALARDLEAFPGWTLLAGHHILVTYHDKQNTTRVRSWMAESSLRPDIYANGHAHLLQYGVYDAITAITTGTGSKLRERPSCGEGDRAGCGEGQIWGRSVYGYTVLDVNEQTVRVQFKDSAGSVLFEDRLARPAP